MKRSTYDQRDYTFGQAMLTLRAHLGLTQAGLAGLPCAPCAWKGWSEMPASSYLEQRELVDTTPGRARLIERYGGNPSALKIVAETIVELFGGDLAPFLEQGEVVFGRVRELLSPQIPPVRKQATAPNQREKVQEDLATPRLRTCSVCGWMGLKAFADGMRWHHRLPVGSPAAGLSELNPVTPRCQV